MRKILLLFFLIYGVFLFSQDRNIETISDGFIISLENEEPIYVKNTKGGIDIIDYIQFTDASNPASYKLPSKTILIAIPPYAIPEISVLSYHENILFKSIPSLNPSIVALNDSTVVESYNDLQYKPSKNSNIIFQEIVGYGWFRDFYCAQVKIYTHYFSELDNSIAARKDIRLKVKFEYNIKYDFINEFEVDELTKKVIYNYQIANQFRSNPSFNLSDTTGNWIDYTAEYLKIGTASDGLFKVTKLDLELRGINTSAITPRTFQLFQSGKEVEIIVIGEQDSVFNDQDYIVFFGKRNYSNKDHRVINNPDEDYNEYLNRFTDTTFYFLTWGITSGKRIQNLNTVSSSSDTLNYYKYFEHIENNRVHFNAYNDEVENQFPSYKRNKSWYSSQTVWLYSGTTRNFSFNTSGLIQNKIARFYYKGVSGGSNVPFNSHNISLRVNGELLDSVVLDRYKQVLIQGSLSTNQLSPANNTLSLKNYSNGTNPNFVVVDWYEIEYPSLLKLNSDVLLFEVYEDVNEAVRVIKIVDSFVNNYFVFKLSPVAKHITNYQISNNSLTFIDSIKAGDKYIVADSANVQKPIFYYKKQFVNLRSITQQKDYLAITHPRFLQASQNYLTSIQSFYNVSTDLINVQDVFDEFSYGYMTPEAIRLYLSVTFQNRISPKPSYIILIGDANYDYKDYIFEATGFKGGRNYVPSYGIPVSDNWFVVWNDSSVLLPQMKLGRIPVNEVSELDYYLSKVEDNFNSTFDEWNKRYLFFSGGIDDNELELLKAANDTLISRLISPRPVAGNYTHFYKTISPRTDFGPYTATEIEAAISSGSLFISYIGHSGTATWDNSINETNQLFNDVGRNPLITDFGCSTNKYAEPDIICFGERFLFNSTGQALGYVGNSSLGFRSTAITASIFFYENLISDSISEVGNAHLFSKIDLFNQVGNTSINKIFSLSNMLIGDPAVRIKIPKLPNFKISSSDVVLSKLIITDNLDSIEIKIAINNLGLAEAGILEISIVQEFSSVEIKNELLSVPVPSYSDTLSLWLLTKNKPGIHNLNINIDPNDLINEIYNDDNFLNFQFIVNSSSLRDFLTSRIENSSVDSLKLLNPTTFDTDQFAVELQVSSDDSFSDPTTIISESDTVVTKIVLPNLQQDTRYFLRYKISSPTSSFSGIKSFYNNFNKKFLLIDSLSFSNQNLNFLSWENDSIKIIPDTTTISVLSAGWHAGGTCVIAKDGVNLLNNTFFAGMGIVVFDDITLEIDTTTWFQLFNEPANVEALANLIDSIPAGKIVAIGVADDARNNLSTHLKDAIKSLGSSKIDSLEFRGSWALIGWKGAPTGSVIEEIEPALPPESIFIDTAFVFQATSGFFISNEIGPASYWKEIEIDEELPGDASSEYQLSGLRANGQIDSLRIVEFVNGTADISDINSVLYPKIILQGSLRSSSDNKSPKIRRLSVDFDGVPELGTNYQVVSISSDSVLIGEDANLKFYVYNVGETKADSFKVMVDVINDDNSRQTIFEQLLDSLVAGERQYYEVNHNTSSGSGSKTFLINIDSDKKVTELYEDNNFYTIPFFIKPDTTTPSMNITFDGYDIIDGDYISDKPLIKAELNDPSLLPIIDPSSVMIFLNEELIPPDTSILNYQFSETNPKVIVEFTPDLADGEYFLRVLGKDASGNLVDSAGVERYFLVSNEAKILYVYNFPNPFKDATSFTFKLTQIPDEIKIKIFTIAGRLVKDIKLSSSQLNFDFNKIHWDGRDEDGDRLANGVYLYKVIMTAGDKTEAVTQKLAIVR